MLIKKEKLKINCTLIPCINILYLIIKVCTYVTLYYFNIINRKDNGVYI